MVISAPNTPLYRCDVCNYQEFDAEAIAHINLLIGQVELVPPVGEPKPPLSRSATSADLSEGDEPTRPKH